MSAQQRMKFVLDLVEQGIPLPPRESLETEEGFQRLLSFISSQNSCAEVQP